LGLFAGGVNVQVGQIALSQRDQVAVRAEVGLECGDRLAVALYGGCQFARASGGEVTIEGDGVPVDLDGARDGRFDRGVVAGDLGSAGERAPRGLLPRRQGRVDPVGAPL